MELVEFPKKSDRFVVAGPTRCGKSTWCKYVLDGERDVIVVDPKSQWQAKPSDLVVEPKLDDHGKPDPSYQHKAHEQLKEALDTAADTGQMVVYRVPREHLLPDNSAKLDHVAKVALERATPDAPTRLYYDDLVFVAGGADFFRRAPHYYYGVTTGGGCGLIVAGCIQRPCWVPGVALSESDVRVSFYLRKLADRQRMEELLGEEVPWESLKKYRHSWVIGNDYATTGPQVLRFRSEERAA